MDNQPYSHAKWTEPGHGLQTMKDKVDEWQEEPIYKRGGFPVGIWIRTTESKGVQGVQ